MEGTRNGKTEYASRCNLLYFRRRTLLPLPTMVVVVLVVMVVMMMMIKIIIQKLLLHHYYEEEKEEGRRKKRNNLSERQCDLCALWPVHHASDLRPWGAYHLEAVDGHQVISNIDLASSGLGFGSNLWVWV